MIWDNEKTISNEAYQQNWIFLFITAIIAGINTYICDKYKLLTQQQISTINTLLVSIYWLHVAYYTQNKEKIKDKSLLYKAMHYLKFFIKQSLFGALLFGAVISYFKYQLAATIIHLSLMTFGLCIVWACILYWMVLFINRTTKYKITWRKF